MQNGWMDVTAREDTQPSVDQTPIPPVLFALSHLQDNRPGGSKAMADVHRCRATTCKCRPGAWLLSSYTGWRWAKQPMEKLVGFWPIRLCQTHLACDRAMIFSNSGIEMTEK
jgi:hypothetical protein